MRIICRMNRISDVAPDPKLHSWLRHSFHLESDQLGLEIRREYVVYSLLMTTLGIFPFILEEGFRDLYPVMVYPLALFGIADPSLSRYWRYGETPRSFTGGDLKAFGILSFPEWVEDQMYYESLVDGDPTAVGIFTKYRTLIEQEQR